MNDISSDIMSAKLMIQIGAPSWAASCFKDSLPPCDIDVISVPSVVAVISSFSAA